MLFLDSWESSRSVVGAHKLLSTYRIFSDSLFIFSSCRSFWVLKLNFCDTFSHEFRLVIHQRLHDDIKNATNEPSWDSCYLFCLILSLSARFSLMISFTKKRVRDDDRSTTLKWQFFDDLYHRFVDREFKILGKERAAGMGSTTSALNAKLENYRGDVIHLCSSNMKMISWFGVHFGAFSPMFTQCQNMFVVNKRAVDIHSQIEREKKKLGM